MPGRDYQAGEYRYGFNGKENDDEVKGVGNQQDYGMRIYNPRIGRFLSVDPLFKSYPWYTPYQFAGNKPIQCIDLDGEEESIPIIYSDAYDRIQNASGLGALVRGVSGNKVGSTLPVKKSTFDKFLESIAPFKLEIQPAPHIAQAINFGNAIGSVVYDYKSYTEGEYKGIRTAVEGAFCLDNSVFLTISGYSELGQAIIEKLRTVHCVDNVLSDGEIADYIGGIKMVFKPDVDYSFLFWVTEAPQEPGMILNQVGPVAIPLPGAPTAIPTLVPSAGSPTINTSTGSLTINIDALAAEFASSLAPGVLQMSKKKGNQKADDLPDTKEGLEELKQEIKERTTANNGKITADDKKLKQKIKKQEKAIGERNKQKRNND
jgi:RHS repeat-associated protein